MKKTKEDAEITRQSLLQAALTVFSTLGYQKTRLEDIAEKAGFTRGAIYHNFGGKARIFEALIDEYGYRAKEIVRDVHDETRTPCENIRIFIKESLAYLEENESYRKIQKLIILSNLQHYEELHDICKNIRSDIDVFLSYLTELLKVGIEQGEFSGDIELKAAAVSILGLVNGVSILWLIEEQRFSVREYSESIAENLLNGLKQHVCI